MNAATPLVADEALKSLSEKERLRLAERVFVEAGFTSLLPSLYPINATLPEAEAHALAQVGLKRTPRTRANATKSRASYVTTFLDLFHKSDTSAELAAKLGLDPSRIRQRIRDRSLLSLELNGERRVPRFQFEGKVEVPGLSKVLAATANLSPVAFAMWFLTPTPDLELEPDGTPTSPREWLLRTGDIDAVLALTEDL